MNKILPLLIVLILMTGCAAYNYQEVSTNLETGKPEGAYNYLKKHSPKKPDIPHLYELALTAHYANLFSESSEAYELAKDIAEKRYTKSVTAEGLSILTSDRIRPYSGQLYERIISHYYHALNYMYQDKLDGAMVECRSVTNLINYFKGDDKYDFLGAGFLAQFSGIIFEAAGEWNDAFISYKQAADYYRNAANKTGVQTPKHVGRSLVRLSRRLNFSDEYERYRTQYGDVPILKENHGELILFYETGYIARKEEDSLTFPILKADKFGEDDNKDSVKFATTLRSREGMIVDEIELEYLLRVAMPVMRSNRPNFNGISVSVGDGTVQGELVGDIEIMAIETYLSQRPMIMIRTLARALLKYLTFKKAQKESKALGAIVNLAAVITESADTRSWHTLPNQIYMVRIPLPEGIHSINLSFQNANGNIIRTENLSDINITSNRMTILNYRTYE